jgi:hypothetical protein
MRPCVVLLVAAVGVALVGACKTPKVSGDIMLKGIIRQPVDCTVSRCRAGECRLSFASPGGSGAFTLVARTDGSVLAVEGQDTKRCASSTMTIEDDWPVRGKLGFDCRAGAGQNNENVLGSLEFNECDRVGY